MTSMVSETSYEHWHNCNGCSRRYNWINYNIRERGYVCGSCWLKNKMETEAKAKFNLKHQGMLFK